MLGSAKTEVLAYFFKGERDEEAFEAFDKAIEIAPNYGGYLGKKGGSSFCEA